jgi:hypothetical protein
MRSPSSRVLINTCQIYLSNSTRGASGGIQFPFSSLPTYANVPCTIQGRATEVVDDQNRITQLTGFVFIFANFIAINPRDKITFIDANGNLRTTYVESIEDMAGRGAAFKLFAVERL